jgi:hypothetical protein
MENPGSLPFAAGMDRIWVPPRPRQGHPGGSQARLGLLNAPYQPVLPAPLIRLNLPPESLTTPTLTPEATTLTASSAP